ncbi:HlyD family efflux transporter periplasmic adaptor subunit [Agrobacterium rhizogenes]|uniref:HlyD family efflux transporter periplasmic adaptor subunit n=1 Tax=Rhizobium rhizogenes TaxID=359 RepID=UPI0022B6AEB9|nr:HlyD family efflux transporter periplasmic adaptor subunit [Rhizobium rhizogenes]MCZ7449916.1 HlyD family efflux transporter periplasmic adaptor subunit [Rhizobium rhizogenes]
MFTILPEGQKIVSAEIPEQFLDSVKPGVPVEVLAEDRIGQAYQGRISRISPVLMQSTGMPGEHNDIRTDVPPINYAIWNWNFPLMIPVWKKRRIR